MIHVCFSGDELRSQVGKWLDPPDPSSNHNTAWQQRRSKTGEWFVKGEQFLAWMRTVRSFLWIHGICTSAIHVTLCWILKKMQLVVGKVYYGKPVRVRGISC